MLIAYLAKKSTFARAGPHMWGVNRILSGIWVFDKHPSHIEQKNSHPLVMGSIDISGLMRLRQGRLNSPPVYRKY
jgi:hypothetical protein